MIYGAEGVVGLVNVLLFFGVGAMLLILSILFRVKRSAAYKHNVKTHLIRYTVGMIVLLTIALPTLIMAPWMAYTYYAEKPERDTFARNNQNFMAVYQSIQTDDVEAFKNALTACGAYCTGSCDFCDFGKKKYDNLLSTADGMQSSRVAGYLKKLNAAETPKPVPDAQFYELEVKK